MQDYDITHNMLGQLKLSDQQNSFITSREDPQNSNVQGLKIYSLEQEKRSISSEGMFDVNLRQLVFDVKDDRMTKLGNICDNHSSLYTSIGQLQHNFEGDTYVSKQHHSRSPKKEQDISLAKTQRSGRYWQVVAIISCFVVNIFTGGVANSYGVLYTYMQESLAVSEYQLSWIGSLMGGCLGLMAILGTVSVDTIGCRLTTLIGGLILSSTLIISSQTSNIYILYITLGVLPGVGLILSYVAAMVHISWRFSKWLPVATGLSVTGLSVGILIWPPITSGLADTMGWRGALLIQAAVLLHLFPAALLIKPKLIKGFLAAMGKGDHSIGHGIANFPKMVMLPGAFYVCFGAFLYGLGTYTFSAFTPEYARTSLPDVLSSEVSLIISLVGVGHVTSRLIFSLLTVLSPNIALPVYIVSSVLCGVTDIAVTMCHNVRDFFVDGFFYGVGLGGWAVFSLVLLQQFGIEHLSKMIGIFLMIQGAGSMCGPPLLSYLAAVMGQKTILYLTGTFFMCSALVMMPLLFTKRKSLSKQHKCSTNNVVIVDGQDFVHDIKTEHPKEQSDFIL